MWIQTAGILVMVMCVHHGRGDSSDITGYIGQSVTLVSGVNPTWTFKRIMWAIYENSTYICSFQNGNTEVRFWRYVGRLSLNETSGDLTIRNLTAHDSRKFTVSAYNTKSEPHVSSIVLTVLEHLNKPTISVLFSSVSNESCGFTLSCSSSGAGVSLSWASQGDFSQRFWADNHNSNSNESVLWTHFKPNQSGTFYCTADNGHENVTNNITVHCPEEKPELPAVCSGCLRECILTVCIFLVVAVIGYAIWRYRDKILDLISRVSSRESKK